MGSTMLYDPVPTLLIIGGGYAGTALTIRLLESARSPLRIVIAEPRPRPGRGEAYGGTEAAHLLNGPTQQFSLHPEDPGHLIEWATREHRRFGLKLPPEGLAMSFIPRPVFGEYVGEELHRFCRRAAPGVTFEHWRSAVHALRRGPGGRLVAGFADGRQLAAAQVVLATGVHPLAPEPHLAALAGSGRLLSPWDSAALDRIAGMRKVLIVGASLSMVDAVASLETRGFSGEYHVVSRRGHLIEAVLPADQIAETPILDPEALPRSARALLAEVIRARRQILARGGSWQEIPKALRSHIHALWYGADTAERLRFVRHLRALWDVTAHRAAPASYRYLTAARAAGRFNARAARLTDSEIAGDRVVVSLRPRGSPCPETVLVDAVIDARGHQEHDWRRIDSPLVRDLLASGLARPHATGFGLDAALDGAVRTRGGETAPDLHAIGHPLRGVTWESSSLTEQREQAARLAPRLLDSLRRETPETSQSNAASGKNTISDFVS